MSANVIAQITASNTFQQWLGTTQVLVGSTNLLTNGDGETFYANTRLEIGGTGSSLNVVTGASIETLRATESYFQNTDTVNAVIDYLQVDELRSNTILIDSTTSDLSYINFLFANTFSVSGISTQNVSNINVATILQVTSTNTTTGNANVVFDLDVGGNMIVLGNTELTQNLVVVGNTTSDNITISNASTFNTVTANTLDVVGNTNFNGLTFFNKNYAEKHSYVEISANTATINLSEASSFTINLSSNITTMNVTTMPSSTHVVGFTLFVKISEPLYSITWPEYFRWQDDTEPTLSIGTNDVDIFTFLTYDGGTNWFAVTVGQAF
jgi:hypothetical protein